MYRLISLLLLFVAGFAEAQTTVNGSFVHGGINRTYSFYVPASYVPGLAVPLVFGLHGTSSSGAAFAQYRDFRPIADTANFIVVHPDGSTLFGISFWNYGNVMGSTVDDVGFLEALIDTISAQYTINPNRIYSAGMSNGSFMSYCLACESDRFAAVAGVTGSMSVDMYNSCTPARPTPTIHIHGTSDPTNPYTGTSTMKAVEDVVLFWADQNSCAIAPVVTPVPDIQTGDGATAERFLYANGINGHTVELFKVTGGEHTWPGSPMPGSTDVTCMDFDACTEIWRFFSQYERASVAAVENYNEAELTIWPNPAQGQINIQSENHLINQVTITDMQGRVVKTVSQEHITYVDLNGLDAGNYMVRISGNDFYAVRKQAVL